MPSPRGLVQWVDQQLHREGVLPRAGKLLVAVSGGADSVALLRLLADIGRSAHWEWELVVGHVEHGIRGKASAADAVWVKKLAREMGLPCVVTRLKLGKGASENAAREGRLAALTAMVKRRRCTGVVMAHHLDDQVETVLMRMFRGCGLEGLAGMRPQATVKGLRIFRPLLGVRRAVLREYLKGVGQAWREDESNASAAYARNRVRAEVLPVVEQQWPGAVEAIGRMSRSVGAAREPVEALAVATGKEAMKSRRMRRIVFSRAGLRVWAAVVSEILRDAVEAVGGTREIADWERVSEAVRLILGTEGGKQVEMGRGVVVRVGKDVVIERVEMNPRPRGGKP